MFSRLVINIEIPIFVNLNIYLDILRCTLSVNINALIINYAKVVIQIVQPSYVNLYCDQLITTSYKILRFHYSDTSNSFLVLTNKIRDCVF